MRRNKIGGYQASRIFGKITRALKNLINNKNLFWIIFFFKLNGTSCLLQEHDFCMLPLKIQQELSYRGNVAEPEPPGADFFWSEPGAGAAFFKAAPAASFRQAIKQGC